MVVLKKSKRLKQQTLTQMVAVEPLRAKDSPASSHMQLPDGWLKVGGLFVHAKSWTMVDRLEELFISLPHPNAMWSSFMTSVYVPSQI